MNALHPTFNWREAPGAIDWSPVKKAHQNALNQKSPKPAAWTEGRPPKALSAPPGQGQAVTVFKDGQFYRAFDSLNAAAEHLGIGRESVRMRLAGAFKKPRTDGWGFLPGLLTEEETRGAAPL